MWGVTLWTPDAVTRRDSSSVFDLIKRGSLRASDVAGALQIASESKTRNKDGS